MYKKITHTIFEEQFDHPVALDIVNVKKDIKSKIVDNTLSNTFRRQVRDVLTHYTGRMRDTILAISNNTGDQVLAAQLSGSEATNLSQLFGRYFSLADTSTFNTKFGIITSTTIEMAQARKAGADESAFRAMNANAIEEFATLTSSVMNGMWIKDDIVAVFTEITNSWVGQVQNRMDSDWSNDFRLIAKIESYLISGTPLLNSYADTFTGAIITTFPEKF